MTYLLVMLSGDIVISMFSPLPSWYCHLQIFLKNVALIASLLTTDSIMIIKNLFIFWLKNPASVNDDFWNVFLVQWIIGFSSIRQFTYMFWPERQPINYYVCIGQFPESEAALTFLPRWFTISIPLVSFALLLFTTVRVKLYKMKIAPAQGDQLSVVQSIDKDLQANKKLYITLGVSLCFVSLVIYNLKRVDPTNVNNYPNYHSFWIFHILTPLAIAAIASSIIALKVSMRKTLIKELSKKFELARNWLQIQY